MAFSSPGWFILPLVIAGLWLALRLHFAIKDRAGKAVRWLLFLLLTTSWIAVCILWIQPFRNRTENVFHPPAILLALDRSPSFAGGEVPWLRSGTEIRKQWERLRSHYLHKGFRVLEVEFGESAFLAGQADSFGELSRLSSVRQYLDSTALRNLQGIFLWSDGRFNLDSAGWAVPGWPAPLFPVLTQGAGSGEIQGEMLTLDFSRPDSGGRGILNWTCLRPGPCHADLELRSNGSKVWNGKVAGEMSGKGDPILSRIQLPRSPRLDPDLHWTATLRSEKNGDNFVPWNDSLRVLIHGGRKMRNLFLRPIRSLEERGLMDAIRNCDSLDAVAMPAGTLDSGSRIGDVIWLPKNGGNHMNALAIRLGARELPVLFYSFAKVSPANGNATLSPEARPHWTQEGEAFLPAGVIRLADLGSDGWELPGSDSGKGRLVWAEENGRTGRLLSISSARSGVWDVVLPNFWSGGFKAEADSRIRKNQEEWVQGIAKWARAAKEAGGKGKTERNANPSVRNPVAVELGLLGIDVRGLESLAEATQGRVLRAEIFNGEKAQTDFPEFSAGQIAEEKSSTRPFISPRIVAFIAALLLSALWAIRKLSHLD